ncbi:MAG: EAL domain-containing protein [Lachnospiraceae bacterium]|nr:EAL domain-containing protein [Lachnospiraceae bacterium]
MLNIDVQLCGLVILSVLAYFLFRSETTGLHSRAMYKVALIDNLICVVLDILSIFAIVYDNILPRLVTVISCKLYLVSLVSVCLCSLLYSCTDIPRVYQDRRIKTAATILAVAVVLAIAVLPVYWYHSGLEVYSFGPAVSCAFIAAPLYIAAMIVVTVLFGQQINPRRRIAIWAWLVVEIVAISLQFLNRELLLVSFSTAVGMMIIFIEIENPEAEKDPITDAFAYHILREFVRQYFEDGVPFSGIIICTGENWNVDRQQEREILVSMTEYLKSFKGAKVFRGMSNDFAIVFELGKVMEHYEEIEARFKQPWMGIYNIPTSLFVVPDSRVAGDSDDVTAFYTRYRERIAAGDSITVIVDEMEGRKMRAYKEVSLEVLNAMAEDRLEVFYQPIYSTKLKRFVSAEALARIRNTDGSIMLPETFIPLAEENGYIDEIGARVFEKVCMMMSETSMKELGLEYIEVNLSVGQCENRELSDKFIRIMEENKTDPGNINLEITESYAITQRKVLIENMNRLKEKGCSFSLDDFGNGESNLNYIVDMPVDIVKFDRGMVNDYFNNERAKLIMDSVILMIQKMNLRIVAEGVEEKEQLDTLERIGVDYIQGYYFSKPLPQSEFIDFVRRHAQ